MEILCSVCSHCVKMQKKHECNMIIIGIYNIVSSINLTLEAFRKLHRRFLCVDGYDDTYCIHIYYIYRLSCFEFAKILRRLQVY